MTSHLALPALVVLLSGCDELLPGRRQPSLQAAAAVESVAAQAERPATARSKPRPKAGPRIAPEEAAAAFDQVRGTLHALVAAEQGFYAENGTYSEDLKGLGFRPSGESEVQFRWLASHGWAAAGSHPLLPGRNCVVFVGAGGARPTTLHYARSGREGVVVCDQDRQAAAATPAAPSPGSAPPPVADRTSSLDAVNPAVQMRVDLRNLAGAQDAYYATQGVYSRRPELLQLQFAWQRGVTVTVLHADRSSWAARATHASRPGKSCVVWFGSPPSRPATEADRKVPDRPGVPACDS